MNKENYVLKLVDEIILYYDARSKKTSNYIMRWFIVCMSGLRFKPDTFIYITMAYSGCVVQQKGKTVFA